MKDIGFWVTDIGLTPAPIDVRCHVYVKDDGSTIYAQDFVSEAKKMAHQ